MTERKSFRQGIQFAWDSTSLTLFKECPRKYYYVMVRNKATREQSIHLTFGIYLHQAQELYHRLRSPYGLGEATPTASHEEVLHLVVKAMLQRTWGWDSGDKYKNRETLIRTIVWYFDAFQSDPAETVILANGRPAVELSFRFEIPNAPDFLYCGHIDRLARFQGKTYVFDTKSTKRALYTEYFDKFSPNNQMTGYTLGAKIGFPEPIAGVVIDAAQVGVGFSRFARGFALRTDDQLNEWLDHTAYWVKLAASYAEADFWPLNESSCDKYFGCPFRRVCAKPPKQREAWLEADYVTRVWDPLQTREH